MLAGTRARAPRTPARRRVNSRCASPGRRSQRSLEPSDLKQIEPDRRGSTAGHSTVTVLARLRGWSTLSPRSRAMSIREQLQRDHRQQRRQHPVGSRHPDHLVGVLRRSPRRPRSRSRSRLAPRARTSCMFEMTLSSTGDSVATTTTGVSLGQQRDRAVLHLAGRVRVGRDVGDLLELERALERDRQARCGGRGTGRTSDS